MSAPGPEVSVFHFTSRISSAKIRKYKAATERGMSGGSMGQPVFTTATPGPLDAAPSPSMQESSTVEPPAKRPKLKLNVRRPASESPDTIAVSSRPKRDSSLRIRYSENMVIDSKDLEEAEPLQRNTSRPSPAASSGSSSLSSAKSIEKDGPPAPAAASASMAVDGKAKQRDYSRDFMSYYVTGGDEEDDEPEVIEAPPEPKLKKQKTAPSQPQPATVTRPLIPDQPVKAHRSKSQPRPPTYPTAKMQPPRPPIPQPIISVIDPAPRPDGPRESDTVAVLIKKLETLSTALTNFGGIPALPLSPTEETAPDPEPEPSKEKKDVDDFLAMFDDDDSDEKDDKQPNNGNGRKAQDLNTKLENPGEEDLPLIYGIQFIQNALRSWAIQRTVAQYQQQRLQYEQTRHLETQQKRGPGRPRKFDTEEDNLRTASPPTHIRIDLAKTPEGAAIAAFQEVLDSGCLQVNAVLPTPLTRSLRRLYMQIDHLINQGSRNEPQWHCMSYSAQIAAQKSRVEKWKAAHAKAQQEMVRQQQLAQQQVMQQMGIPAHMQQRNMTVEQAQQQHAIELERKRGLRDAANQPHLTQYLTNPLRLNTNTNTQHAAGPSGHGQSPSTGSPGAANGMTYPNGLPSQAASGDGKSVHLDKIKLYMPNFLPRSGQSMKFSFAPHSELALQAFGAQAFPSNEADRPKIPNRGPMMSANMNVPSNGPSNRPKQTVVIDDAGDNDDIEMIDVRPVSRKSNGEVQNGLANGSAKNSNTSVPSTNGARSSSMPVVSSTATSPAAVEVPNGIDHSGRMSPAVVVSPVTASPRIGNKGKGRAMAEEVPRGEVMVVDE